MGDNKPMMRLTEKCYKNALHDETGAPESDLGLQSPCLRMKGHAGKHVHEALCVEPSCTCMGYVKKIFKATGEKVHEIRTKDGHRII